MFSKRLEQPSNHQQGGLSNGAKTPEKHHMRLKSYQFIYKETRCPETLEVQGQMGDHSFMYRLYIRHLYGYKNR